jgi:type VI secretion system protein ImpE
MSAEQSLREGKVTQALEELQRRVRANPGNAGDRIFLFQLLSVLGQWERAATQLDTAGDLDASALITVQIYRRAIEAELLRAHVFSGATTPLVIGEPQEWLALLLEALKVTAQGHFEEAAALRARALEEAPAVPGTLNGEPFEWLSDGDSRLGPCLELIVDGKYCWTPVSNVRSLHFEAPADLRDTVWSQCALTWSNGGQVPALIPTRYCGSERGEPAHQLSRRTDWDEKPGGTFLGLGQRMLVTDQKEYSLLEVRDVTFETGVTAGTAAPATA